MQYSFFGKDGFIWWMGVVEDRKDPIFLGRVRVRIFGWHTDDLTQLPTADLPWAVPSLPLSGGRNSLKEADWCWGFFMDGQEAQKPVVVGYIPGINEKTSDPNKGFGDPTDPNLLEPGSVPRPPNMGRRRLGIYEPRIFRTSFLRYIAKLDPPQDIRDGLVRLTDALFLDKSSLKIISELPSGLSNVANELSQMQDELTDEIKKQINSAIQFVLSKIYELADLVREEVSSAIDGALESVSRFANENSLPGTNLAFGELANGISLADFDILKSKFDVNKDGQFNEDDVIALIEAALDGGGFFDGYVDAIADVPMSSYPLADRLNEPSTSRLSRNEKIEQTIVELKRKKLIPGEGAGFAGNTVGGAESSPTTFMEPMTPYAAKYPYNLVHESESGHVIEVDDTPGAERLHWYHKSGTFREIHPDGVQVSKTVNSEYNIIYGDYYNSTDFTFHVDAKKGIRLKSSANINMQSTGDLNNQVGSNLNFLVGKSLNSHVGENVNQRIGGKKLSLTENDSIESIKGTEWKTVSKGIYIESTGGPIKIESNEKIQLISPIGIDLLSPVVNVNPMSSGLGAQFTSEGLVVAGGVVSTKGSFVFLSAGMSGCYFSEVWGTLNAFTVFGDNVSGVNITGNLVQATVPPLPFGIFGLQIPPMPIPPVVIPPDLVVTPNKAENDKLIEDLMKKTISSADGGPKYGFFIPNGVVGDVYKPISDSTGNLVTLSALGSSHQLCEAIPTPVLEKVLIKYEAPDGKITQWEVIRPVHVPGKVIDTPVSVGMFEDKVRHMVRWPKPGREYPKQMFWIVNGKPMLILDSAERHQCKFGPYNDKL